MTAWWRARTASRRQSRRRHLKGKNELIALAVDHAIGPSPRPTVLESGWRETLMNWAQQCLNNSDSTLD